MRMMNHGRLEKVKLIERLLSEANGYLEKATPHSLFALPHSLCLWKNLIVDCSKSFYDAIMIYGLVKLCLLARFYYLMKTEPFF